MNDQEPPMSRLQLTKYVVMFVAFYGTLLTIEKAAARVYQAVDYVKRCSGKRG